MPLHSSNQKLINIEDIPNDIWYEIMSFLNPQELSQVSQVSKRMHKLFESNHSLAEKFNRERKRCILTVFTNSGNTFVVTWFRGKMILLATGRNYLGELSLDDKQHRDQFTFVPRPKGMVSIDSLQGGDYYTILIGRDTVNNPLIAVCGDNTFGQLGLGDYQGRNTFTLAPLPKGMVSIDTVQAGGTHTILIGRDTDNSPLIAVCGNNYNGQLGLGDKKCRNQFTFAALPNGMISIDTVQAGYRHTILIGRDISNNPLIAVCGSNSDGQLGLGDNQDRNTFILAPLPKGMVSIDTVQGGGFHTTLIGRDTDNNPLIAVCGYNSSGQLGLGDRVKRNQFTFASLPKGMFSIDTVQGGGHHTILLGRDKDHDPLIAVCGWNYNGELGLGDNQPRTQFTLAPLPKGMGSIDTVKAGNEHTILIGKDTDNNPLVAALGGNNYGQLGLGDTQDRNQFTFFKKPSPETLDWKIHLHKQLIHYSQANKGNRISAAFFRALHGHWGNNYGDLVAQVILNNKITSFSSDTEVLNFFEILQATAETNGIDLAKRNPNGSLEKIFIFAEKYMSDFPATCQLTNPKP